MGYGAIPKNTEMRKMMNKTMPTSKKDGTLTHCGRDIEWEDHDCGDDYCTTAVCVKCSSEWADCEDRSEYAGQENK